MSEFREKDVNRFWSRVNKMGAAPDHLPEIGNCWVWDGCECGGGYGYLRIRGKGQVASRVSWEMHNGPIPEDMLVCHRCDNPKCVNPSHLFLGTNQDNTTDKETKGRGVSKFSAQDVITIRQKYAQGGTSHRKLGKEYQVNGRTIGRIVSREVWRYVPEESAL